MSALIQYPINAVNFPVVIVRKRLVKRLAVILHSSIVLFVCKCIIASVSAYDIFLTVKYFNTLPQMEMNPLGRWMMRLDHSPQCCLEQIAIFIAAKTAGNFIAFMVLDAVGEWRRRVAVTVGLIVATGQLMLLYYLTS